MLQHQIMTYVEKQRSLGTFKVPKFTNKHSETGVVYNIPCKQCDKSYIGQTSRELKTRIAEHQYAIKKRNMNNSIARHNILEGHDPDFSGAEILTKEKNTSTRVQKESWFIAKNNSQIINHMGTECKQMSEWMQILERKKVRVAKRN